MRPQRTKSTIARWLEKARRPLAQKKSVLQPKGRKGSNELIGLAKNESATLGANAIVAGEIGKDGKMKWVDILATKSGKDRS